MRANWRSSTWVGYVSLSTARLFSIGLGLLLAVASARLLRPAGRGDYAAIVAGVAIGAQLFNFGLSSSLVLLFSRNSGHARRFLWTLWVYALVVGVVVAGAAAAAGLLAPKAWLPLVGWMPLWAVWIPLKLLGLYQAAALTARRRLGLLMIIELAGRVTAVALGLTALFLFPGMVRAFVISLIVADLIVAIVGASIVRRMPAPAEGDSTDATTFTRSAIVLGLRAYPLLLLPYVVINSDLLIVRFFRGAAETGVYSIAAQVVDVALILPATVAGLLLPEIVQDGNSHRKIRDTLQRILMYSAVFCVVAAVVGRPLIRAAFGAAYSDAYLPLLILLPGFVALALESIVVQFFNARGFPLFVVGYWSIATVANLAATLLFVPRWGMNAAALASTGCYGLVALLVIRRYRYEVAISPGAGSLAGPLAVSESERHGDCIAVSMLPLPGSDRAWVEMPGRSVAEWLDIAWLRRAGAAATLRRLRERTWDEVCVVGSAEDLATSGDALSLLALAIPARRRWRMVPGSGSERIRWISLPATALRLLSTMLWGLMTVALNVLRCAFLREREGLPIASGNGALRCLYLKPTLAFGPLVGGSVGHVSGVVNALADRGCRLHFIAMRRHPLLRPSVKQAIVPPPPVSPLLHELNLHRYHRRFAREALREAQMFQPSLLYQRYSLNDLSGALLRRRLRVPLILEFNGSEVWAQQHWGKRLTFESVSRRIEEKDLRCADVVVVVSEQVRDQVLAAGVAAERVVFYPNCVDATIFDPRRFGDADRERVRAEMGVPVDADLFTFVGTFGQWHGTDVLAQAIRTMVLHDAEWLERRRIRFLFVGDGPLAHRVREILGEDLGKPFVILKGFRPQEEAPGVLAASDVLLSPHVPNADGTPFFGSPTKLFEYMAMGKPIVASDLDQIGQVLRGWRPEPGPPNEAEQPAAILVRPGDVDSLIGGIRRAAEMSQDARKELGALARSYVLRAFTWDRNVAAVLNALDHRRRQDHAEEEFGRAEAEA